MQSILSVLILYCVSYSMCKIMHFVVTLCSILRSTSLCWILTSIVYCVERCAEPIKEDKGWQGLGHSGTSSQRVFPQNSPSNCVSLTSLHMEATLPLSLSLSLFMKQGLAKQFPVSPQNLRSVLKAAIVPKKIWCTRDFANDVLAGVWRIKCNWGPRPSLYTGLNVLPTISLHTYYITQTLKQPFGYSDSLGSFSVTKGMWD